MTQRLGLRVSVMGLVAALMISPTLVAQEPASQAFTLNGHVALWTVAIKPDKTADFEQVMAKLRDALSKSTKPHRKEQLAGWTVVKVDAPLPDGNIAYVHLINPVVSGADYNIMQALYDEFPDERQALYELYRGSFVQNLSLATGSVAIDLSIPASLTPPSE